MKRRSFLGLLSAAMASAALDPERLLWIPGAKSTFLPPSNGWFTPHPYSVGIFDDNNRRVAIAGFENGKAEFHGIWGTIAGYAIYNEKDQVVMHGSIMPAQIFLQDGDSLQTDFSSLNIEFS